MALSKQEYNRARDCLKKFRYNARWIEVITDSIPEISAVKYDGLPHAKYTISDSVANTIIQQQDNKELQKALKEYNAVVLALEMVSEDSQYIFKHEYYEKDMKWYDIIDKLAISERTYKRRRSELIYAVAKNL